MSQFHLIPGPPYLHTLNKGSLSLLHSLCPCSTLRPPDSVGQSLDCLTSFGYVPLASSQGNIIALTSGRSLSIDDNTCIIEDRPRGPCILVSLTSLMSSLDHLRGVLSASRDGCFSCAHSNCIIALLRFVQGIGPYSIWSKTPNVT